MSDDRSTREKSGKKSGKKWATSAYELLLFSISQSPEVSDIGNGLHFYKMHSYFRYYRNIHRLLDIGVPNGLSGCITY